MYCTIDDIIATISESEIILLTDDNQSGLINQDIVNNIILNTTTLINGYVSGVYKTSLISGNLLLKAICVDLTIYELYKRRKSNEELYRQYYEDAMAKLEAIADGTIKLSTESTDAINSLVIIPQTNDVFGNALLNLRRNKV